MTAKPRRRTRQTHQDPDFNRSVGRAIKVLRTVRGLSRRDLADRAGVSYPYLSEIENGTKAGSPGVLRSIAEALEVPMHEMLAAAEEFSDSAPRTEYLMEPEAPAGPLPSAPRRSRWFTAAAASPREARREHESADRERLLEDLTRQLQELSTEDIGRVADIVRRLNS